MPETMRATALVVYMALFSAIVRSDSNSVGWSASADTRANTITTEAAAVRKSSSPTRLVEVSLVPFMCLPVVCEFLNWVLL